MKIIAKAGFSTELELRAMIEDPELIKAFGVPERGAGDRTVSLVGLRLPFPDTYRFRKGTPAKTIVKE